MEGSIGAKRAPDTLLAGQATSSPEKSLSAAVLELPDELQWLILEMMVKEAVWNPDRAWLDVYYVFYHHTNHAIRKKVSAFYVEYARFYSDYRAAGPQRRKADITRRHDAFQRSLR